MNIRKVLVIAGLLAVFSSTSAFATTEAYYYSLLRGGSSKCSSLVTKDGFEQTAYVTATSNTDWEEGTEGYYVRVRRFNGLAMTSIDQLGGPIYKAGIYQLSYDMEHYGMQGTQYRLWASYNDDQPNTECYATGRWTP